MVLSRDITVQQGDTAKLIVPVLDGDDADAQFLQNLSAVTVEFALADGFGGEQLITTADVTATTEEFGNVKLDASAFDDIDTIPDTQDVVTVLIPAGQTQTLAAGTGFAYQVRLESDGDQLTPVKGNVEVEAAAIDGGTA